MSKPREHLPLIAAGAGAIALIVLGCVYQLILAPAARLDEQARLLTQKIAQGNKELERREPQVSRRLADLNRRTFGTEESGVSEAMRARLMGLLAPSGMNAEQFNSTPVNAQRISRKTNDREVSRNINIRAGKLTHAINLLYLLASEPYVHRIDSLTLKPSAQPGRVDLQFRYSTLALESAKGAQPSSAAATTQLAVASLDTHEREVYKIIEERDIFRPYVKRPPQEPPPPPPPTGGNPPPPPPPPPPPSENEAEKWRVVGLPTFEGSEVALLRRRESEAQAYKIGQVVPVLEGKVVLIDCREIPRHDNPKVFSSGRVVFQMKDTFWAVELGDRLADKHRLSPADLPPELRSPATAPAVGLSRRDEAKS